MRLYKLAKKRFIWHMVNSKLNMLCKLLNTISEGVVSEHKRFQYRLVRNEVTMSVYYKVNQLSSEKEITRRRWWSMKQLLNLHNVRLQLWTRPLRFSGLLKRLPLNSFYRCATCTKLVFYYTTKSQIILHIKCRIRREKKLIKIIPDYSWLI